MKNLLASWFRNLTAFDDGAVKKEFSIVDPTAAQADGLNTVILAVSPSDGNSPTMVSLYFDGTGVKLFEKKYQDDQDAQTEMSAMAHDLEEAATLSKEGKTEEAKNLATSLFDKYKRSSDPLSNEQPTPTMTQASQNAPLVYKGFSIKKLEDGSWQASQDELAFTADSIDSVKAKVDNMLRKAYGKKLAKRAEIVMQNLFFSTPDEAMEYQEKMKKLQGPEGGEGKPLWEQMSGEEQIAPSNETAPEEDNELAPPSLSFDRIEKDKAKSDKDIGKRIKEQVKTEVESALEQKSASVFGPDQEDLVEALRKNGRNWDEIKKIFTKELSYNEDDTTVFLDSIRQKEEGGMSEGLPMAPKPPEDLVSPETHDKLVKEIEDKSEPKPEPLPLADEIARADNAEIRKVAREMTEDEKLSWDKTQVGEFGRNKDGSPRPSLEEVTKRRHEKERKEKENKSKQSSQSKVALNPLQEPPAVGQNPGQPLAAPVEEAPTFDSPVPPSQDSNPEPEFLEAPKEGDRVYVMGDYETGQDGFEGTMVSDYTSKGDDYAVIAKDDGENAEVALHRVVKASQKKVAQVYYEKVASVTDSSRGRNWKVTYYDKNDKVISSHIIKDRTEAEAEREATGDMPSGCEDWSMMPVQSKKAANEDRWTKLVYECPSCETQFTESKKPMSACPICRTPADKIKLIKEAEGLPEGQNRLRTINPHNRFCDKCGDKLDPSNPSPRCAHCSKAKSFIPPLTEHDLQEKDADLEVEGKGNEDVIRMFIDNSFPKDKMPVWGTPNLKITKYPNGWALVNYQTPILYRGNNNPDVVVFNTHNYSVTTKKIQNQIRSMFRGQSVKETDEAGIYSAIDQSNLAVPEPEFGTELQSLHESALKIKADLEHEGEIAIYFHKEGIEKKASDDSAFEGNGWCRVWIQDDEISSDKRYPEILKLADETTRIDALKDLARELAHEALRLADSAGAKVGVQAWFESLHPSDHDRIDWVALANPTQENVESAQDPKIEKKAAVLPEVVKQEVMSMTPDMNMRGATAYRFSVEGDKIYRGEWRMGFEKDDFGPYQFIYDLETKEFKENPSYQQSAFASLKQAAEPLLGPTGEPLPAKPETPTTFKKHLKAPPSTDREKAQPASIEQAQLVKEVESSLTSLESIKSMVEQAKAKLNAEIKTIEEKGGRVQIEGELKEKIDRLSKMVEAVQNQMIYAGDTMVRLVQETKEKPFKPGDKWKIEKLTERLSKYEDAAAFLKKAEDGAQHLATSEDIRELYFFPRKMSKLHKSAGFLETLDSVYNDVLEALKLIIGSEEPAAV